MIFEKVKETIIETISCSEEQITMEASLKEDIGIDSLDAMELSMSLEEAFEISIDEDALSGFVTVKDIVDYITEKTA